MNTSEKILSTAIECLSTRGYANVSMRDIAKRAGVALSQLTYHYKTKEALYSSVIDSMANKYLSDIALKLKQTEDIKHKYSLLIEYFRELLQKQPNLFKMFMDFTAQALWNPVFADKLNDLFKNISNILEEQIFVDYQNSAEAFSRLLIGAFYGVLTQAIISTDKIGLESLNALETVLD